MKVNKSIILFCVTFTILLQINTDAYATQFRYSSSTEMLIPSTSKFYGRSSIFVPDSFIIESMEVTLDIDHTKVGDLGIFLTSPQGFWVGIVGYQMDLTSARSLRQPDGPNYNMEFVASEMYTFTDSASSGLPPENPLDSAIPGGDYLPEDFAGFLFQDIFSGENAQGNWHLDVFDNSINNGGRLISWTIDFNTNSAPVPEPATMLLFATGLAGLYGASRKRKN